MGDAYSLYVNLTATTGGLTTGLRTGATQLRSFDGQLQAVNRSLIETGDAASRLARIQDVALADTLRSQTAVTAAVERSRLAWAAAGTAAQTSGRAETLAATTAARAETERAAAVTAGEQALRAQALAQTMAARAAATTGAGAAAAQATATAAAQAATRAATAQAEQEQRAAAAQATATRAANLAQRAAAAQQVTETTARQATMAQANAEAAASQRAAQNAAAVRQAQAAATAEARASTQATITGYLKTGAVISAVLGAGVLEAVHLQKEMANVLTISKEITPDNVSQYTDEIVRLSTQLPQTSTQLAQGLYQIVSTGYDGADAMQILQVAAKGASAGLTTTDVAATALLGVMKSYGLGVDQASDVMDTMFQTVNLGVISFEQLAQQLGDVVPMAAAAGVGFGDLSSALAAITLAGIPAAESSTALNMLLTRMMAPTTNLRNALHSLGYESGAAAVQQDGLYVVMNKLEKVTGGNADATVALFNDVRASRAALALAAADGQNYADTYQGIAQQVDRAGATQRAYDTQMQTTSGQWTLTENQAKALGISMGTALLPVLESVGSTLRLVGGSVNDLPGPMKSLIGIVLALVAAGALLRAGYGKVTLQFQEFRTALAATRAGGSVLPTVLSGAGLAVTGLSAVLMLGVAAYSAYSAAKERAKEATQDLVQALQQERNENDAGAGIRELTTQLTNSDDMKKLNQMGIATDAAIDAITSGGAKLDVLYAKIAAGRQASFQTTGNVATYDTRWDDAKNVLDKEHKIWSDAVQQEDTLATEMQIVNSKIAQSRIKPGTAFDLSQLLPVGQDGLPQYTDEMTAMAKALGGIVDPAQAWQDAQNKVAQSNKNAKATLTDYVNELESQLKAQRSFQDNLAALGEAGYTDLADHFASLGVSSAGILQQLATQLGKGNTKVADQLEGIITESTARSQNTFRLGLEQLPGIAATYGKQVADAWAKAAETNDSAGFAKVMQTMAVTDMTKAVQKGSTSAKSALQKGMALLSQVAQVGGVDAANTMRDALLKGDMDAVTTQLGALGSNVKISAPDLTAVVGAFKTAGKQANSQWSGMLTLIAEVSKSKGEAAAQALTSALLSGDMAKVQSMLNGIGAAVQEIPGSKTITVSINAPKSVTIPVYAALAGNTPTSWDRDGNGIPDSIQAPSKQADGSVLSFYAKGGLHPATGREQHVAQIAPAGAWRVWAEEETGGESYIPLAPSKRTRSRAIAEETVRRLGGKGVRWYADGGLDGWSYSPSSLYSLSGLADDSKDSKGNFSLALFQKKLRSSVGMSQQWQHDLTVVAQRAGVDVAQALADMGEDGIDLTRNMATGSTKYVKQMAAELQQLADTAKGSLSDYTLSLSAAAGQTSAFQKNLAKLAAEGYGDLASRLAEQGDTTAQALAAQAVKSQSAAAQANKASTSASSTLSQQDMADLLTIIAAVKTSSTGIHKVADATGLGEDQIITVADEGKALLKQALGTRGTKFLADLALADKGLSYEKGGLLTPGIYATSNGIVRFAEPATGGEAYVPLGTAHRGSATNVLRDVADRFGYQVSRRVDAHPAGAQVVVVQQPAALIGQMPVSVTTGSSGTQAAAEFGAEVMRRLRAAQRGGRI